MKSKVISLLSLLVILTLLISSISLINRFSGLGNDTSNKNDLAQKSKFINWDFSKDEVLNIDSNILDFKAEDGYFKITEKNGGYNWGYYYIPISIMNDGSACELKDYKYITFEFDYAICDDIPRFYTSDLTVGFNVNNDIDNTLGDLRIISNDHEDDTGEAYAVYVKSAGGEHTYYDVEGSDEYGFLHCKAIVDISEGSVSWYVQNKLVGKHENIISSSDTILNVVFYLEKGFTESEMVLDNIRAQGFDLNYSGSFEDLLSN